MNGVSNRASPGAGTVDVLIVGAGHSGLAMSHCLARRGIEHVVLERGEIAHAWRHQRWDSLRLLTPNWLTRLPGMAYDGDDPDGFMGRHAVADFIERYARASSAPVRTGTTVLSVRQDESGYHVDTDRGRWRCRALVIASGAFAKACVPRLAADLPPDVAQLTPYDYRNPGQVEAGGVLVVGASATGLQLADELQRAGRSVTIAVGEHVRMPRTYRGRDIQWWMHETGLLDQRFDAQDDLARARGVASPQLVGSRERQIMDLNALSGGGARLVGRVAGVRDGKVQLSGSLRNVCALADLKMGRLLGSIDDWLQATGRDAALPPGVRFAATRVPEKPVLGLDLRREGIRTVIWATGFRPDHAWLHLPAFDRKGRMAHAGGVATLPGLYLMGLPFLRRRKSSFIHGAEDDAYELSAHLATYLDAVGRHRRDLVAL
ncbi:MAG: NAD(P)-binding domain-containing protein [Rhodocyclaceae bacterium]|nr:NAD(P)-binding domain-containing protein [Rhodocyclaceae bacterium]